MQALFEQVEQIAAEHGARRAVRVVVEVGEFSNLVPELFKQAFDAFRQVEPLLQDAQMELRVLPLLLSCPECGLEFRPPRYDFRCPDCSSLTSQVVQGEELLLRDVELEVEEEKGKSDG